MATGQLAAQLCQHTYGQGGSQLLKMPTHVSSEGQPAAPRRSGGVREGLLAGAGEWMWGRAVSVRATGSGAREVRAEAGGDDARGVQGGVRLTSATHPTT